MIEKKDQNTICKYNADDILCYCLSIKRYEIESLIIGKRSNDIDSVMNQCGGGTVCNGCKILFSEMMGESVWTPVKVTQINRLAPNVKSFRFEADIPLQPAQAGQHIVIQACINNRWELRRYTLTTPAEEQNYREITVKSYSKGVFSNWLHQLEIGENERICVSKPMGDNLPSLINTNTLICFVAGIGITPALSFIRTISQQSNRPNRPILIDHSVNFKEQKIAFEELQDLALNNNIEVNLRVTKNSTLELNDERLNQQKIIEFVRANPNSDYFLCGPPGYIKNISSYLDVARISKDNIFIDDFTTSKSRKRSDSYHDFYVGLLLLIAFFLQDALQLKMDWLETLQSQDTYKIYSGIFFLIYLISLFVLPYTKLSNKRRFNAKAYQKHKHRGVLAPVIFYIHSTNFGTVYLLALTLSFFATLITGLFNHDCFYSIKRESYFKKWLPLHISFGVITMFLIGFHIYVVSSY